MGTNYYAVKKKPSLEEPIHIGKSSFGWLFLFQEQNDTYREYPIEWHTYNQVKEWLEKHAIGENAPYVILDEYEREIPLEELLKLIEMKQRDERCKNNPDNFNYNTKNVDGYRFTDSDFS